MSDMKSIYASINGPGSSGILDRPSLCVSVLPAWDSDNEIGDRSGLELEVSSSSNSELYLTKFPTRSPYYYIRPEEPRYPDSLRGGKPLVLSKIRSNLARGR